MENATTYQTILKCAYLVQQDSFYLLALNVMMVILDNLARIVQLAARKDKIY